MAPPLSFGADPTQSIEIEIDSPSDDEELAPEYSLGRARDYLRASSTEWYQSRGCVTCHTNGLHLLSAGKGSQDLQGSQTRAREYLDRLLHQEESEQDRDVASEAIVATAAFLAISESGNDQLDPITRSGLDRAWQRQSEDGHWPDWLKCNWPPYEVDDHFGVTLMAVAMGHTPKSYQETPLAKEGMRRVTNYLQNTAPEAGHQKGMMLWAESRWPGLLEAAEKARYVEELRKLQKSDGGWNTATLGPEADSGDDNTTWERTDGTDQDFSTSDGYATGFVAFVLQEAGLPDDDAALQAAIGWLKENQRASGRWFTRSPRRDGRHFISNAGTSFAVLALSHAEQQE